MCRHMAEGQGGKEVPEGLCMNQQPSAVLDDRPTKACPASQLPGILTSGHPARSTSRLSKTQTRCRAGG